ncbi:MAG: hypothetical protein WCT37_01255 [Patescibacteria group bacterium]|jgi:hypothetical protein
MTIDQENFSMPKPKIWRNVFESTKERLEQQYPVAFSVMEVGGVRPDKSAPIPNPYLDNELDREDFRNVGEHNVAVASCAEAVAEKLFQQGAIDGALKNEVVSRALIHDVNKRFEVFRRKAQKAGKPIDVYSVAAYDQLYKILVEQGVSGSIVEYIKNAGKETGHNSLADFISLNADNQAVLRPDKTFEEMLVHLADDMTASPLPGSVDETQFVTVRERMALGDFKNRYPFLYQEGLGFDADRQVVKIKDCGDTKQTAGLAEVRTYADWQEQVSRMICDYLKTIIQPESETDPEEFIKNLVNHKIFN